VQGGVNTVVGLYNIGMHPIDTYNALNNLTLEDVKQGLYNQYAEFMAGDAETRANMLGQLTFEAVGTKGLGKISKAGKLSKLSQIGKVNNLSKIREIATQYKKGKPVKKDGSRIDRPIDEFDDTSIYQGAKDSRISNKGTNNPIVKSRAKIGQEAHRQLEAEGIDNWIPEQTITLPNGKVVRKDGVSRTNPNLVRIIKPDTPSGIRSANKRAKLMKDFGYETQIDLYNPLDARFQPGSPSYIGPRLK
jgi:hypothetical protein